ncbi:MAG TPA: hypothetical protein VNQ79_13900 [Blastocatellia bacterium]|nr:hypothetical protein [Blastocatellia bacterium]
MSFAITTQEKNQTPDPAVQVTEPATGCFFNAPFPCARVEHLNTHNRSAETQAEFSETRGAARKEECDEVFR